MSDHPTVTISEHDPSWARLALGPSPGIYVEVADGVLIRTRPCDDCHGTGWTDGSDGLSRVVTSYPHDECGGRGWLPDPAVVLHEEGWCTAHARLTDTGGRCLGWDEEHSCEEVRSLVVRLGGDE